MKILISWIQKVLGAVGLVLLRTNTHESLVQKAADSRKWAILRHSKSFANVSEFLEFSEKSESQLDQELVAASIAGFRKEGFFVEFGATNGVSLSNSLSLERDLNWTGILAEPGHEWQDELRRNRKCAISNKAVWSESGKTLSFLENAELSTLVEFKNSDQHARRGKTYDVETISLLDLLREFDAPRHIDFLSVDTEGSELEVLSAFDFSQYSFGFICVEHNFTPSRQTIQKLLESKGYAQILSELSEWDDWFVPSPGL